MKRRKYFALLLAALLAVSTLAGCGGNQGSAAAPAEAGEGETAAAAADTIAIAYNKPLDSFSPVSVLPDQTTTSCIFEPLWRDVKNKC